MLDFFIGNFIIGTLKYILEFIGLGPAESSVIIILVILASLATLHLLDKKYSLKNKMFDIIKLILFVILIIISIFLLLHLTMLI